MPTIYEIAQALDVNISTVSRALSGKPGVSDATRDRVLTLANEMGYRPNDAARNLSTGRSHTVALLSPAEAMTGCWSEILPSLEAELRDRGYSLRLVHSDLSDERSWEAADRADGVIAVAPQSSTCEQLLKVARANKRPALFFDPPASLRDLPAVRLDREGAARRLVSELCMSGCRRIGVILDGFDDPGVRNGYRESLRAAGLDTSDELICTLPADTERTPESIHAAAVDQARALISRDCDAVLAANDWLAFATLAAADAMDRRVPQDLAVAGIGDLPYASVAPVPITSWRFDIESAGRELARRLLAQMQPDAEQTTPAPTVSWVGGSIIRRRSI